MFRKVFLLVLILKQCSAVIRDLNETEYARMPRIFQLDEYRSCLLPPGGVYCAFKMELYPGKNEELMDMIRQYSDYRYKHYNHTYLERGVCVTQTCQKYLQNVNTASDEHVKTALEACVNQSLFDNYGLEGKISNLFYCDRHGQKDEVNRLDVFVAFLIILVIIMNIAGTVYHSFAVKDESKANKALLSFSLTKNWEELKRPELVTENTKNFVGLNGMRCISLGLTLLAHVLYGAALFSENPQFMEKGYDFLPQKMVGGGLPLVQAFFAFSGFFLTHGLEVYRETNKVNLGMLPKIIIMRWVRLTPGYVFVVLFTATWHRFIDSGPLWNILIGGKAGAVSDCRKYMWHHFFYINNYAPDDTHCAIVTWHIATDFQLFCFGAFVYLAVKARHRMLVLVSLLVIGHLIPTYHMWRDNLDAVTVTCPESFRTLKLATFRYLHTYGHNNLPAFITGMIAGLMVYKWQKKGLDWSNYHKLGQLGWIVVPYIITLFSHSVDWHAENPDPDFIGKFFYGIINRMLLCLIIAYIIIGITMNVPNKMRSIIEWNGWTVPCRLSYSVYLIQAIVIYLSVGIRHSLVYVSYYYLWLQYFGIVGMTFAFSVPFYLMVEAPINKLFKAWLKRGSTKRKEVPIQDKNGVTKDVNITYPIVHKDQNGIVAESFGNGKGDASFRDSLLNNIIREDIKKIN